MKTRIITGIFGAMLAVFIINNGGGLFAYSVLALILAAWYELSLALSFHPVTLTVGGAGAAVIWLASLYASAAGAVNHLSFICAAGAAVFLLMMTQPVFFNGKVSVPDAMTSAAGVIYTGFMLSHFILLREWNGTAELSEMQAGCAWLWVALLGTWASDTFAYFGGSAFGRTKLAPAVSPQKTVEGFISGAIGTTVVVAFLGLYLGRGFIEMVALGVAIAVAGAVGDLVESAIKRYAGIKDSGMIIPGHGGVLDRFDSAIFTVPLVYYALAFLY